MPSAERVQTTNILVEQNEDDVLYLKFICSAKLFPSGPEPDPAISTCEVFCFFCPRTCPSINSNASPLSSSDDVHLACSCF